MANENYDELVKDARDRVTQSAYWVCMPKAELAKLADAVEQLVAHLKCAETRQIAVTESHEQVWIDRDRIKVQLRRAEQQIAYLREALQYYEKAESVTFPALNKGDPHGDCKCGHPESHAYASGYLKEFMRTTDYRNIAAEALARDDEAAKKWA